jgi:hypothetical protein
MADLAIGHDVIGPHQIEIIDLPARHELINLDRAGGFERDVLQLVLGDLEIAVAIDLEPLMMSSKGTSSPVSASTFTYRMRWSVFLLI